ncbi:DUF1349 domain-containing protein [Streptomyces avicenniae]|uniref:DUF1349 domain-containing protein n=1 Tax=Streptomyces avicenniae TaxID=500153 RepID=UPI000699DE96|nr:DUF1349 domain-containing protein [Streptomyces avicenniae]
MDDPVTLPAMPAPLHRWGSPVHVRVTGPDALTLTAGPRTDLFADPGGPGRFTNAPALLATPQGDYVLSARVRAGLSATYDAGVLLLYAGADTWAKLALELSPQGRPTVVTVVNRGVSDDANAFPVESGDIWLRVARVGRAHAFHASTDGRFWHLVRWFALPADTPVDVGFLAQSPTGEGLSVHFEEIVYTRRTLADPRDGS